MTASAKNTRRHMDELHFDNLLALNKLIFYKQELEIFQKRLEQLSIQNSKKEVTARIEQFQNQFIRQKEVHDELRHKIKQAENELEKYAAENTVATDRALFEDNNELREEISRYEELYAEMKSNFYRFLSTWM